MKEEWGKWGIFEGAVVNGRRAVGDAGPYGEVTRSAVNGTMWASSPTEGFMGCRGILGGITG